MPLEEARNNDNNFAEKGPQEYGKFLYFHFKTLWLKNSMREETRNKMRISREP